MAAARDMAPLLAERLAEHDVPVVVVDKLRHVKAVDVADFAPLSEHSRDLGRVVSQLTKVEDASPDVTMCTEFSAGRIRNGRPDSLHLDKPIVASCQITRRILTPKSKKSDAPDAESPSD